MAKTLRSTWYQNGEDFIFADEAFHELAYRITGTYQRYLAELEQEHGESKAKHEAWVRGWRYEYEVGQYTYSQVFFLPGYKLRVLTRFDADGLWREASIILLFE